MNGTTRDPALPIGNRPRRNGFLPIRRGTQMTFGSCLFLDRPAKADPPITSRTDNSVTIAPYRSGKPTSYTNSKSCRPEANETSMSPLAELRKASWSGCCVNGTILQRGQNSCPIRTRASPSHCAETRSFRGPTRMTDIFPLPLTNSARTPSSTGVGATFQEAGEAPTLVSNPAR